MDYILEEMRLSRAFACQFEKFWRENPDKVTKELLTVYLQLKKHYDDCISKELS
jgi:hypothetical protein